MSKLLLPLSVSLIASLSFGMPVRAEMSTNTVLENSNPLCSRHSTAPTKSNLTSNESLIAQVIVDSRPHWSSQCGNYYTIYKYGKYYECHKCTYGGPYCWQK